MRVGVAFCVLASCGRIGFDGDAIRGDGQAGGGDALVIGGVYAASSDSNVITYHAATAVGDTPPLRTIAGTSTGISSPLGLFVDLAHRELYVANFGAGQSAVRAFPLDASGNVAPTRVLPANATTRLSQIRKAIVDLVHDELIVLDLSNSINVYPRTAAGSVAPLRRLAGLATLLDNPIDFALDPVADELFINSYSAGGAGVAGIVVFDRTASGDVPPKRVIAGANTRLGTFTNTLALDVVNRELFAQAQARDIVVFDTTANGNVVPKREITGAATSGNSVRGMVVDTVTNRLNVGTSSNDIRVFARTDSGAVTPIMIVAGPMTSLGDPAALALDGPTGFIGP